MIMKIGKDQPSILDNYHQRREDVFNFEWFKLVPPSIDELQEARENA